MPRNSPLDRSRAANITSVPAAICDSHTRHTSAKAAGEGDGSHPMKRVSVGVAAAKDSAASAAVKERSATRADASAIPLRSRDIVRTPGVQISADRTAQGVLVQFQLGAAR